MRSLVRKVQPLLLAVHEGNPEVNLVFQVNLKAQHVEYNRFYIPDITSLVDIQEDYLKWFLSKPEMVSLGSLQCDQS